MDGQIGTIELHTCTYNSRAAESICRFDMCLFPPFFSFTTCAPALLEYIGLYDRSFLGDATSPMTAGKKKKKGGGATHGLHGKIEPF